MVTLSPFSPDPFFENLRIRARLKTQENAAKTSSTSNVGSEDVDISRVGEQMTSALDSTGVSISSPSSQMSAADTPSVVGTAEPRMGTTEGYSSFMRIAEGVSANLGPLAATAVTGKFTPVTRAAQGITFKSAIGQTPRYLEESTKVEGLPTQVGGFQPGQYYTQEETGAYRALAGSEADYYNRTGDIQNVMPAGEAARRNPLGYTGPDPRTPGGQFAQAGLGLASVAMPAMGLMTGFFGPTYETPIGTKYARGSGLGGILAEQNYKTMWKTHEDMVAGAPGNFGMKVGNTYYTYQARKDAFGNPTGFVVGGTDVDARTFQNLYAAQLGYDPKTVDFENSKAGELYGERLQGFSPGVGGFSPSTGEFVDARGRTYTENSLSRKDVQNYVDSLAYSPSQLQGALDAMERKREEAKGAFFGADYKTTTYAEAVNAIRDKIAISENLQATLSPEDYEKAMAQLNEYSSSASNLTAEQIKELGLVVNIQESDKAPGATQWREVTDPETGVTNRYNFNLEDSSDRDSQESASSYAEREESFASVSGPDEGEDDSEPLSLAAGGRAGKSDGDMVEGPVGFVNGRTPEEVSEADTVADDVEGSVPEGTFVINASAVEEYGSERIRKLLVSALQEAERQGIDISASDSTIVDEDSVSVAVSEGEVLVPPVLVRIIGLKKLKQINSLGQEEVAERVEEYGQAEVSEPVEGEAQVMASVDGGFIERQKKFDGGSLYKAIPTNVRLLGEFIAGKDSPITEEDFTEEELKAMADAVERAKSRNTEHEAELRRRIEQGTPFVAEEDGKTGHTIYRDYRGKYVPPEMLRHMDDPEFQKEALEVLRNQLKTYEDTRNKTSVRNYYVNEVANPGGTMELLKILNNPLYQLQTTLGEYRATENNDGVVIDDEYNFNTRELREMIGKDEVELVDILKNLDTPQLAAELFARYVQPDHKRSVNIKIPNSDTGFIDIPPEFE
jgi:hypothetical protein